MMRNRYATVPVERLRVPPDNFNEMTQGDFAALVAEVRELGTVVHPVVARQDGEDGLIIVDGVHQINAARAVGLREVPVEVLAIDQFEATRQAFMRNRHGRHNPVKLGGQWRWMQTTSGMTNRALADLLAVSEATVRNMLIYSEAADRYPEREAEIAKMGVRQVRVLLDQGDDEQATPAPAESPRHLRPE
jgi:ParB-like chromosome segregation protein Spo0J